MSSTNNVRGFSGECSKKGGTFTQGYSLNNGMSVYIILLSDRSEMLTWGSQHSNGFCNVFLTSTGDSVER